MKLWTIWIQVAGATWLEGAWDDESTAENHARYLEDVGKAEKAASENDGQMRVIALEVPDAAIFGAFEVPTVKASLSAEGVGDE